MAITALPVLNRTDATFKADVDTFFGSELPQFSVEAEAARVEINDNTVAASTASAAAANQATLATTQAQAAAGSALVAGAVLWVSGTTYVVGDARYSPINLQTYRRKVAGAGTTDPSLDAGNWVIVSPQILPNQTGNGGKFLTTNGTAESWGAVPASALTLLAVITPTVAANVDALNVFNSAYDNYLIVADGLTPSSTDQLRFQLAVAGVADTAANYYITPTLSGTAISIATTNSTISGNVGASGKGASFDLQIGGVNSSGAKFGRYHSVFESNASGSFIQALYALVYTPASVVTGVRLLWNSGSNFQASGKISIYGYSNT